MLRSLPLLLALPGASAWNDIAGALTYKGTSHVFQGCPGGGQPGSQAHGWHHAATTDLVHWQDRGIHVEARLDKNDRIMVDCHLLPLS
jgi:sucrose-6-phosphate hydrolase SacC (GH32 family)